MFVALSETIHEFDLPQQPLADLLAAFRRDQVQTRYETLDDLLTYCEKSANPVGRIVLHLGACADAENMRLSDSICTGLQLANFWQDVSRDYARGRIYIPQENCRRARLGRSAVSPPESCDAAFRECCGRWWTKPSQCCERGSRSLKSGLGTWRCRCGFFIGGGRAILAAIRRTGYDVWSRRPTVGRLTKLRLLSRPALSIDVVARMTPELEAAFRACRGVARRTASNFACIDWLLPLDQRRGMQALYAFARRCDDIADST